MTKYSNEFKVKAIKMVLKGNSISHVAKRKFLWFTKKRIILFKKIQIR